MADISIRQKSRMKGRGWQVSLAVLALLIGVYVWDQKAPAPREPDSQPPVAEFMHATSGDISRVELKRASGGFALARDGREWKIESPGRFRANTSAVDTWLKGLLEDATVDRVVEGRPGDAASYGLDKPSAEIVFTRRGGETRTLQLGKDFRPPGQATPGSVYYAREAKDGRLFMLSSSRADEIRQKKLDDLRDRRLVLLDDEKAVQKIVIERAAGPLEVQRKNGDRWELVRPFTAPADKSDVDFLIGQIKSAEAESFVENSAADMAKYGLDRPRVTMAVTDRKGTRRILFGKADKDGKVYAAREGETEVTLVAKFTFEGIDKKPADLRERQLITLESDKVSYVELKNVHGSIRLQKVGKDDWHIVDAPDPKQKKAKTDQVQTIVNTLRSPAHKHVEEGLADPARYGLDRPEITVTVNDGRGTSQVYALGKKTKDGNYYARGVPQAVFEVQSYVYSDLNVRPVAFKEEQKAEEKKK